MGPQDLKKKIKSVSTTKKITNAMSLVASAKLKREKDTFDGISDYYYEFHDVFHNVMTKTNFLSKLDYNNDRSTIWIIVNSNLGLCGSYNYNVNKLAADSVGPNDGVFVIGKKGYEYWAKRIGINNDIELLGNVDLDDNKLSHNIIRLYVDKIMSILATSKYTSIKIIYTRYINQLTFSPMSLSLLPVDSQMLVETNDDNFEDDNIIEYETNEKELMDIMIPMYLSNVLYGALIESKVSENASRRNAMDSAIKNAEKLIDDYTIEYNKLRQEKITNEIIDIIGASEGS